MGAARELYVLHSLKCLEIIFCLFLKNGDEERIRAKCCGQKINKDVI